MDSNLVKSYISFVGMLVSAKPEYLTLVLGKIANGFTYRAFHLINRTFSCLLLIRIWSASFGRKYA